MNTKQDDGMEIPENISMQEKRILHLLAQGKQNKYIAEAFCLSEHTVKNHKANLCRKLNLTSTTDLYFWAIRNAEIVQQWHNQLESK